MTDSTRTRVIQIALTLTALEFFGPILRDFSPSHAMNESWVGHARVHLVWLLGFMAFSGIANLYFIWWRRPLEMRNLRIAALWQSCNLGGFWVSYLLLPVYGGSMTIPGVHTHVFGVDENVFAFAVISIAMAGVWFAIGFREDAEAGDVG